MPLHGDKLVQEGYEALMEFYQRGNHAAPQIAPKSIDAHVVVQTLGKQDIPVRRSLPDEPHSSRAQALRPPLTTDYIINSNQTVQRLGPRSFQIQLFLSKRQPPPSWTDPVFIRVSFARWFRHTIGLEGPCSTSFTGSTWQPQHGSIEIGFAWTCDQVPVIPPGTNISVNCVFHLWIQHSTPPFAAAINIGGTFPFFWGENPPFIEPQLAAILIP